MAAVRISVRLDRSLRQRLAQVARGRGRSESDVVREALTAYLAGEDQDTCYTLARRLGLIGAVKDAPADLSTNPKHLEGLGRW